MVLLEIQNQGVVTANLVRTDYSMDSTEQMVSFEPSRGRKVATTPREARIETAGMQTARIRILLQKTE